MNIYDIAKKANVSVATVSRVINQSGPVRESTRKKVEKAIAEMHYTPSAIARSLSSRQTNNIGIIVPDIFNPFYARVLTGITRVTRDIGYNTFFFNAEENIERLHQILDALKGQNLNGIILNPVLDQDEETVRLKSHIEAVRTELNQGGSVGRKLDFIAQEMNREANTILSKANDMEVSGLAIALKTEIEKVREQIQNIE